MKKCIIPGSYDPVTCGHIELFEVASRLFDVVHPVILCNSEKKSGMFTSEERLDILNGAIDELKSRGINNIVPVVYSGLTTDIACELKADYVVKGVRNATDFTYEYDLSEITRRFCPSLQTVFIPSKAETACVSSTYVRELIKYKCFDSEDFAKGTVDIIKKYI